MNAPRVYTLGTLKMCNVYFYLETHIHRAHPKTVHSLSRSVIDGSEGSDGALDDVEDFREGFVSSESAFRSTQLLADDFHVDFGLSLPSNACKQN